MAFDRPGRLVAGTIGIDPDLAWDEDGTCYLTWCSFAHDGGIAQARWDRSH